MSTLFEAEIREQPAALRRLLVDGRDAVEDAAHAIHAFRPRFVVTAARGSSDNAARYAKYLFGIRNGLVVSLGAPSLVTLYGAAPALADALVVGISQSGQSPDIVALVEEARRQGALTVALCNQPASPLGRVAAHVVDLHAGVERAVAASKSYTAELLALAMLSAAMAGRAADARDPSTAAESASADARRALDAVPDAVERTLALSTATAIAAAAGHLTGAERLLVLGRGYHFATAFEVALKIKETTGAAADPYATPDLFHGPLAMVGPGYPALVVAHSGAAFADAMRLLPDLHARGVRTVAISDDPAVPAGPAGHATLLTAPGVPEWLSPITAILPGQLLALAMAKARGLDADQPRGLAKVTRTR